MKKKKKEVVKKQFFLCLSTMIVVILIGFFYGKSLVKEAKAYDPFIPENKRKEKLSTQKDEKTKRFRKSEAKVRPKRETISTKRIRIEKWIPYHQKLRETDVRIIGKIKEYFNKPIVFLETNGIYYAIKGDNYFKNCEIKIEPLPHLVCYELEKVIEQRVIKGDSRRLMIEKTIENVEGIQWQPDKEKKEKKASSVLKTRTRKSK